VEIDNMEKHNRVIRHMIFTLKSNQMCPKTCLIFVH